MLHYLLLLLEVAVICIFVTIYSVRATKLLLVGDSVDRLTVREWCFYCGSDGLAKEYQWGDSTLKYHDLPTYICDCQARNHSVAFVQIFGSHAHGPYQSNIRASAHDPYIDTSLRVEKALQLYFRRFGPPDRIIFHSLLWDYQLLYYYNTTRSTDLYMQNDIDQLELDINNNLDQITSVIASLASQSGATTNDKDGNHTTTNTTMTTTTTTTTAQIGSEVQRQLEWHIDIGLRTAVFNTRQGSFASHARPGGPMLHAFNDVVRRISRDRNITLYDFDDDVWGSLGYDYSIDSDPATSPVFRDWLHPKFWWLILAAEKMLGNRYSACFIEGGAARINGAGTLKNIPPTKTQQNQRDRNSTPAASSSFRDVAKRIDIFLVAKRKRRSTTQGIPGRNHTDTRSPPTSTTTTAETTHQQSAATSLRSHASLHGSSSTAFNFLGGGGGGGGGGGLRSFNSSSSASSMVVPLERPPPSPPPLLLLLNSSTTAVVAKTAAAAAVHVHSAMPPNGTHTRTSLSIRRNNTGGGEEEGEVYFLRRLPPCSCHHHHHHDSRMPPPPSPSPLPSRGKGIYVHGRCYNSSSTRNRTATPSNNATILKAKETATKNNTNSSGSTNNNEGEGSCRDTDSDHDNNGNGTSTMFLRYNGIDAAFLLHMHLGPADIYYLTDTELEAIPLAGSVPRRIFPPPNEVKTNMLITTTDGVVSTLEKAQHVFQSPFFIRRLSRHQQPIMKKRVYGHTNYSSSTSTAGAAASGGDVGPITTTAGAAAVGVQELEDVEPFWLDGMLLL